MAVLTLKLNEQARRKKIFLLFNEDVAAAIVDSQ